VPRTHSLFTTRGSLYFRTNDSCRPRTTHDRKRRGVGEQTGFPTSSGGGHLAVIDEDTHPRVCANEGGAGVGFKSHKTRSERTRRESTWTDGYSLHDPEATQPLLKQVNNGRLPLVWSSRRRHVIRSSVSEDTPWCRNNSLQAAGICSSNWS